MNNSIKLAIEYLKGNDPKVRYHMALSDKGIKVSKKKVLTTP